jgi:hypothetical protein
VRFVGCGTECGSKFGQYCWNYRVSCVSNVNYSVYLLWITFYTQFVNIQFFVFNGYVQQRKTTEVLTFSAVKKSNSNLLMLLECYNSGCSYIPITM